MANVQGTVPRHRGRQGTGEHPGAVPGSARPLRGQGPRRRAGRRVSRGVPAHGVGALGGEAERAVGLQQRGPGDRPPLRVAREGRHPRRGRTDPDRAGHAQGRGPRQERADRRRRPRQVRGVGPRALRRVRAHRSAEAAVAVRQAVGARGLAVHVPVLVDEVAWLLRPRRGGWVIDGTVGMGGHAEAMLASSAEDVRLLGIDVDPEALARAGARLAPFADRVTLVRADFRDLARAAAEHGVSEARAVLLDLGVSSYQIDESGRGFSFQQDEPLDMRLDPARGETAADLVNRVDEAELVLILFEHGGEPFAPRIARTIVGRRPLRTTGDLVAAVRASVPRAAWPKRTHVATRTFQALRMAANDETGALRQTLQEIPGLLAVGGRLGVISFHSGEDRIGKQTFRAPAAASFAELEPLPLTPRDDEGRANPRARSAKLRVLERTS